ncbi:MAG: NADH-quinone oxidoreductase subunit C [Candidatus Zixiibacteriota bacterium]|nr:MAG: NADH-quinone oxidoreductase subunit C [candidate division Zixibacteria bacterium]
MVDKVRAFFDSRFADAVIKEDNFRHQQSFYIKPNRLLDICQALLDDGELDVRYLSDITSLDWLNHEQEKDGRFEVVYNLYSISNRYRFFIKVPLPEEQPTVQSLTGLWAGANWLEREVFDLMGIHFDGHPNLTKILTPDDLEGHPLRKDFPLTWEVPAFSWNKDEPPEVIR